MFCVLKGQNIFRRLKLYLLYPFQKFKDAYFPYNTLWYIHKLQGTIDQFESRTTEMLKIYAINKLKTRTTNHFIATKTPFHWFW